MNSKRYDAVFFDLDGTLTDPGVGITNSVAYALRKSGLEVPPREALYSYIGPPLAEAFLARYRISKEQAERMVGYYREYYAQKGITENVIYPGVAGLLRDLDAAGIKVVLATSKPEVFANKVLAAFGIDRYFTVISGAMLDGSRLTKADVLAEALRRLAPPAGSRMIMVGDREYDVRGALEFGMETIGVLYGFGSREELVGAGAVALAEDADELRGLLL